MLFSTAFALLSLVSAAPLTPRQNKYWGDVGSNIVAGSWRNAEHTKCLAVRGGPDVEFADGLPVEIRECSFLSREQNWLRGAGNSGQIRLANTNFCLDAGVGPKDGRRMKIWTCYEGLKQQNWYWTDDARIALTDQGLCLDNTNGSYKNGNRVQVWTCGDENPNQEWTAQPKSGTVNDDGSFEGSPSGPGGAKDPAPASGEGEE
jgi:hypothetical protein